MNGEEILYKVVDKQPCLWINMENLDDYITCEDGSNRIVNLDERSDWTFTPEVEVYYHVVKYKGKIYVLYVYYWPFSYYPGFSHCWDYEPIIMIFDKNWDTLQAVYDAGHYDTEEVTIKGGKVDLQVIKGTHGYTSDLSGSYKWKYAFEKNKFHKLDLDMLFRWEKNLSGLIPSGPHDLSLLDAYLFPWTVGPDEYQIDAFTHEVSILVWADIFGEGGKGKYGDRVYSFAKEVLDRIDAVTTNRFKNDLNTLFKSVGLVDSAKVAIEKLGVGPDSEMAIDWDWVELTYSAKQNGYGLKKRTFTRLFAENVWYGGAPLKDGEYYVTAYVKHGDVEKKKLKFEGGYSKEGLVLGGFVQQDQIRKIGISIPPDHDEKEDWDWVELTYGAKQNGYGLKKRTFTQLFAENVWYGGAPLKDGEYYVTTYIKHGEGEKRKDKLKFEKSYSKEGLTLGHVVYSSQIRKVGVSIPPNY